MFGRIFNRGSRGQDHGRWDPDSDYYREPDPYGDGWNDEPSEYRDAHAPSWQDEAATYAPPPRRRWWQSSGRQRGKRWWAVRFAAVFLFLLILIIGWLAVTAPLSKSLEPIAPPQITLTASDGTPIARNGAIVEDPVEIAALPPHVAEAFLAIEDRRFYSHWGIDPLGLARAAWGNATSNRTQGGSTITQQLAKFTFLTPEQTMTRKAREMLIAFWLEGWLTKDEILERYLSNAYFGDNLYGLRAASLHYFYRKPENLTLAQSAMLAGLVQAPSRYAPTRHYERAKNRMDIVVGAMVAAGYLTQAEADKIRPPAMDNRFANDVPTGTYFADWALPEARKRAGGGYARQTIATTLDAALQGYARRAVGRAPLGGAQVALVAMRPSGEVVAMVGGKDYSQSAFNRAVQAKRQPGSTFKLFVYLAALRAGARPDDLVDNSAIETGSYRPRNYGGKYSGMITLEDAFARSSNVAAVRLFTDVGSKEVIAAARDLGVTSNLPEGDPSLALGSSTMTLLELTAAYAGIAGNSFPVVPHAFAVEEESWLGWLTNGRSDLPSSTHTDMLALLRAAVNGGTGSAAMLNVANYGKTGTTQDNRDALFVGFAGDLVVGVWIGNDDNAPLAGVTGGGMPARIWRDFMTQALGVSGAAPRPSPSQTADPRGPVEPMDVPDIGDIPVGDNGPTIRIRDGETVIISGDIEGFPIDVEMNENGVSVNTGEREPAR